MTDAERQQRETRVLLLAPTARDAAQSQLLLTQCGVESTVCASLAHLCEELEAGAAALLLTEEALADSAGLLAQALGRQPPWSDLPVLVLARGGVESQGAALTLDTLGNVTLLDRPVRVAMLVSAVKTAVRARRRQYQLREHLADQERAREALRESQRLYHAIGESIDYGVWMCDAQGRNVYASQSFLNLVGLTQQQCSEFGWGDTLHPDDAERTLAAWRECVRTGGAWDIEHRFRGVDGQWHPILARGVPVRDDQGEVTSWVGINLDISRQKAAEAALRDADRRKDEFLAMLAHELRNPLAAVVSAAAVLRSLDSDDARLRRQGEVIARQSRHMARLLDDLLDVSRITQGRIELRTQPVDLAAVVEQVVAGSRPLIEERGHEFVVTLPPAPLRLMADPARLEQVLANLLNNAAKYTPAGGRIAVSVRREGAEAVVRVRDTGAGISPELLPRVFDLFTQAERTLARSEGGLGIGLTMVKRLVEMHDGRVTAHSDGPGCGSEFVVCFPLLEEAEELRPTNGGSLPHPPLSGGPAPKRVLVVEDNRDAAETLGDLLELWGLHVTVARDGEEALRQAAAFQPDLVLLDIGLPGMDGYEVARRLRDVEDAGLPPSPSTGRPTPVRLVALTGYGHEEARQRAQQAGFDHHLTKPVDPTSLRELVTDGKAP